MMLLQRLPGAGCCEFGHSANCSCLSSILQTPGLPLTYTDRNGWTEARDLTTLKSHSVNAHFLPATGKVPNDNDGDVELLVVEGLSALHAVDNVRQPQEQAVLCIQGKLPNADTRPRSRVLAHEQCQLLFSTLGCGTESACNPELLRYQRICLLVEGDADGKHVLWLQLMLFKQYLAPLLETGLIRVIHAPVARINAVHADNQALNHERYLWDEAEKRRHLDSMDTSDERTMTAFKGIASLASPELNYLLVDRTTRREKLVTP